MPRKKGEPRKIDEAAEIERDNRDLRILKLAHDHPDMRQQEIAAEVHCSVQRVNDVLREDALAFPGAAIRDMRREIREGAR